MYLCFPAFPPPHSIIYSISIERHKFDHFIFVTTQSSLTVLSNFQASIFTMGHPRVYLEKCVSIKRLCGVQKHVVDELWVSFKFPLCSLSLAAIVIHKQQFHFRQSCIDRILLASTFLPTMNFPIELHF